MNASAHWYDRYGQSAHQQPNKTTGGLRPTTITDARKLKLLPSVTTIQQLLAKPQLERWKLEQVAGQAWESFFVREDDRLEKDQFVSTIIEQAFKQVEDAADLGTDIHAAIENHFQGRPYDALMGPYVLRVANWAEQESVEFLEHELRLVSEEHGYAGITDAVISCPRGNGILDFKSRKTKPGQPCTPWETEPMQVAAYFVARFKRLPGEGDCGVNVYVSTTEPGRIEASWYDYHRLCREWHAFEACCLLWRHLKQYDPRKTP